jgi:hypothetical protein
MAFYRIYLMVGCPLMDYLGDLRRGPQCGADAVPSTGSWERPNTVARSYVPPYLPGSREVSLLRTSLERGPVRKDGADDRKRCTRDAAVS